MATSTELLTVADYLSIPDPREGHLELHHGKVALVPPPTLGRQILQDRISTLLKARLDGWGIVLCAMTFRPTPEYEVWQADVGFLRLDRAEKINDDEYLTGAPDLVVEVLSPGDTVDEIDDKRTICLENGCLSFWVVNDKRKLVSVTEGNVTKHYGPFAKVSCSLLPEELSLESLFV